MTPIKNIDSLASVARARPLMRADVLHLPFDQVLDLAIRLIHEAVGRDEATIQVGEVTPVVIRICTVCGKQIPEGTGRYRYCTSDCKRTAENRRARKAVAS